ncbi:hypothetical protein PV666_51270, partial [Streptomyces acidiscabies]|nr:hypothetical protein [Streptomyces acidiscabies]
EVGHGATVAVWPGTVLLVVDQRIVRWERAYTTYDTYPVLDADVALLLVLPDATLKPLWTRHFKTARGAFGPTGLGQVRKHSAAHPVPGDGGADKLVVRETAPGPGRPNYKSGPCRWCGETVRPLCHRFDVASAAPEKR